MSPWSLMMISFSFGAVAIVILSFYDFHLPYMVSDIRYAVLRERYWLAIVVYCVVATFFYFVAVSFTLLLVFYLNPRLDPAYALLVAVPATIALIVAFPHLPLLHRASDAFRRMVQTLARYPQTVETITAIISRSALSAGERATNEVARELEGYGVPETLVEPALTENNQVLTLRAAGILRQVCSLHMRFDELRTDPRLRNFFIARADVFSDLDKQYRRVLRRSARGILLAEDLSAGRSDHGHSQEISELVLEVSDFIAQECEELRERYQRLVAEVSLSGAFTTAGRTKLISSFGYEIFLPRTLPFAPLVTIFVLDFLFSVAPIFFLPQLEKDFALPPAIAALTALGHAVGLTLSVFFAVYPKSSTNFARPSLHSLPWRSYVLFGLVSYLIGNAILYVTYRSVGLAPGWPAAHHPLAMSSLLSIIFLINTVVLSILLDIRLRNTSLEFLHARLRDGMTLAVVMASVMITIIISFFGVTAFIGVPMPALGWQVYALSISLFAMLGFVMGYLIPSTAEAHIEASKFVLRSAEKEGRLLGFAAQQYRRPEAASAAA
jgi:hypothetical protein